MSDLAAPAVPDLFDLPHAADPSPRAAAQTAPIPGFDADGDDALVHEARPGYADPPPPFYASPDGRLRLYQADALELLRRMQSESVDMIFADPPYFLSNGGIICAGGRMVRVDKGGWDKSQGIIGDHNFNLLWLDQCRRILKPDGTLWVTGTSHNIHSVGYGLQVLDYKILNDIAWYKVNPPPNLACRYFTHATETLLWAATPPGKSEKRHGKHPTQKPEALLTRIAAASTSPDQLVLDPFCGSAMTGVACARLGRRFIGIEREQEFPASAAGRLTDEVQQVTLVFVFAGKAAKAERDVRQDEKPVAAKTWNEIVSYALETLGGEADLKEINQIVRKDPRTQSNPTWPSTVRRVVRQSTAILAVGRGRYRLWPN